jgi:hypothetical protein
MAEGMPRSADPLRVIAPSALALAFAVARPLAAQEAPRSAPAKDPPATEAPDRFSVSAQSETYVQLYRRALVPGQNGQVVPTETAVPITEYLAANARDLDAPWQKDAIGMEFAAWGRVWPTSTSLERPFDGDVQTANVRLDAGPAWTRIGRQQIAGGAARFARFDGITVGARQGGLFAEGYGGFTVLPRWDARMGYHQLGSQEDTLLTYQPPPSERHSHWLAGGRVGYQMARVSGSVSFHDEQVEGAVDHRNLGLDLGAQPIDEASVGGSALLDLDSGRFGQARLWVDASPHPLLDVGAEFLHAEPALLLSRQSIFSVFTTDSYEEFGGTLSAKVLRWLRLDAQGYVEAYEQTGPGARGELATRVAFGRVNPTVFRVAYARVIAPQNGYQGVRASFSRKLTPRVSTTLEAYGYFYDQQIAGYSRSSVFAGTAAYRVLEPVELLLSASLASSPYAALDAQTMLRAVVSFDRPSRARLQ